MNNRPIKHVFRRDFNPDVDMDIDEDEEHTNQHNDEMDIDTDNLAGIKRGKISTESESESEPVPKDKKRKIIVQPQPQQQQAPLPPVQIIQPTIEPIKSVDVIQTSSNVNRFIAYNNITHNAVPPNRIKHMFLWIVHGGKPNNDNCRYECKDIPFNNVIYYSENYEILWDDFLRHIENPMNMQGDAKNFFFNGKEKAKVNRGNKYLRPLLFYGDIMKVQIMPYIGLYHIVFDSDNQNIIRFDKIISNAEISIKNNNPISTPITYSYLFNKIKEYADNYGIDTKVDVAIYACDAVSSQPTESERMSKEYTIPSPAINFVDTFYTNSVLFGIVNPNVTPFINQNPKYPLAGLTEQGCGLNVLAYCGVISYNEAVAGVTCLNRDKGTSIFQIVKYIHAYYTGNLFPASEYYSVIRFDIRPGTDVLFNMLNRNADFEISRFHTYGHNYESISQRLHSIAVIVKLYKTETGEHGHSICFHRDFGRIISCVDPQLKQEFHFGINNDERTQFYQYINHYGFKFMDIVFCDKKIYSSNQNANHFKDFILNHAITIRKPDLNLNFGGGRSKIKVLSKFVPKTYYEINKEINDVLGLESNITKNSICGLKSKTKYKTKSKSKSKTKSKSKSKSKSKRNTTKRNKTN